MFDGENRISSAPSVGHSESSRGAEGEASETQRALLSARLTEFMHGHALRHARMLGGSQITHLGTVSSASHVRSPDSHHSSSSSSSSSLSSAPTSKSGNWLANSASAWSSSRASYFSSDSVTRNCRSRQQAPPGGCSAISPPSASDANRPLPKCTRVCTPTVLWRESSGGPSPSSAACIASTSLRAAARTDACRSRSLGSTRSSISAASRCGVSVAARRSAARRTLDDGSARSELTTLLAS
mmetsp:Transcript_21210/g.54333  ORF Transcript_21210/g.54333 Transcript_21210/m.54333 type:complete len:241 (-) Transcript_21210:240-962(-)